MIARRYFRLAAGSSALVALLAAGCASRSGEPATSAKPSGLSAVLSSRWTAPDFATRVVDAERAAVFDSCVSSANALGYAVSHVDGARGRVYGARRPAAGFEGGRQETLEIGVTQIAPGVTQVSVTLRETIEAGAADERGAMVTTALVRDRAPYDAFFARLAAGLPALAAPPAAAP
jgi:hypothetical protein